MNNIVRVDISAAKAEARRKAGMRLVGEDSNEDLEAFRDVMCKLTLVCEHHSLKNGGKIEFNEREAMALYRAIKGS
jgi:hypothetical protein